MKRYLGLALGVLGCCAIFSAWPSGANAIDLKAFMGAKKPVVVGQQLVANPFYLREINVGTWLCGYSHNEMTDRIGSCGLVRGGFNPGVQGQGCDLGDIKIDGKIAAYGSLGTKSYSEDVVFVMNGNKQEVAFAESLWELRGTPAYVDEDSGEQIAAREGLCEDPLTHGIDGCREYQGKQYILCYDLMK